MRHVKHTKIIIWYLADTPLNFPYHLYMHAYLIEPKIIYCFFPRKIYKISFQERSIRFHLVSGTNNKFERSPPNS